GNYMKFHRKFTALALAMVSVLLVAGAVSASAQSGTSTNTHTNLHLVYNIHVPPGKIFHVKYRREGLRTEASDVRAESDTSGALSRAFFDINEGFRLQTAIHAHRFSGHLRQVLLLQGAPPTFHGVADVPAESDVTLTNAVTGKTITLPV